MQKNQSNEPGVDWDLKELEDAFDTEFIEIPDGMTADQFRQLVMEGECCGFDLERMKKALAGPAYVAPKGLTRDELISWFKGVADGTIIPEEKKND